METLLSPADLAGIMTARPKTVVNMISEIRNGKRPASHLPPILEVPGVGPMFRPKDTDAWLETLKRKQVGRPRKMV